jgi:hypothetical protein
MQTFILKSTGGQVPFYVSNNGNYTAHENEAKKFNSIQEAEKYVTDGKTYQILESNTKKWVKWVNY